MKKDDEYLYAAKKLCRDKTFVRAEYKRLIGNRDFSGLTRPAAIFMAGSPGAGKTEVSKVITSQFDPEPIRVDADDFRKLFDGYDGTNSSLFQEPTTLMVQKMMDRIYEQAKQGKPVPFILDGTFSYAREQDNIKRALSYGYALEIYYVYQKPILAWQFTNAREVKDGRFVHEDVFINTFLQARDNVLNIKKVFGNKVSISVIIKDDDAKRGKVYAYMDYEGLEKILPMHYNKDILRKELQLT